MDRVFEVLPYSITELKRILSEKSGASPKTIEGKLHTRYFEDYFNVLEAKIILVENNYVDRDYLEDFSSYYVRCFSDYKRKCSRLHFFRESFEENDFDQFLQKNKSGLNADILQKSYLGFVVIKPLPETVIGRTCLETYPPNDGRRHYPIRRRYPVNLFGCPLVVQSLAFQEQDRVAAACATSALWSAFQGTGRLFQHAIPSPIEITKAATSGFPLSTRSLPNEGLNIIQMAQAIRSVHLEPLLLDASNPLILKRTVYSYLRGRVPVLMSFELVDTSKTKPTVMDRHAVTITGFSMGKASPSASTGNDPLFISSNIDKIYAHDDQVGPFARMEFNPKLLKYQTRQGQSKIGFSLSTSWRGNDGKIGSVQAVPDNILIPLYHKIRIPFQYIQSGIIAFDNFLEVLRRNKLVNINQRLRWDVYLTGVNVLKEEILSGGYLQGHLLKDVLTTSMPRFLWRATGFIDEKPILDLIFDATDIEQGRIFVRAIDYDQDLGLILKSITKEPKFFEHLDQFSLAYRILPARRILEWFQKQSLPDSK